MTGSAGVSPMVLRRTSADAAAIWLLKWMALMQASNGYFAGSKKSATRI